MGTKFIAIIAIFFLLASCERDKCEKTVKHALIPQSDKNLIPYKGGETLTFMHVNTGDTIKFVGEPNWTDYSNSSYSGADCVIETRREGRGIAFFDNSSNKLVINQYLLSNGLYISSFEINFGNLFIRTTLLGSPFEKVLDSINIQKNTYYDVYFYSNDDTSPKPTNYGCYYTKEDGIIKLFTKTGETWELINKH